MQPENSAINNLPDGYRIVLATPNVETYRHLRTAAGLSSRSIEAVTRGLAGTLFAVQIYHADTPVGMGRVIGDGGSTYQIADMAVLPAHQGKGLGKTIMRELMRYLEAEAPPTAYISLIADGDASHLYAQLGFEPVAPESIGMGLRRSK